MVATCTLRLAGLAGTQAVRHPRRLNSQRQLPRGAFGRVAACLLIDTRRG